MGLWNGLGGYIFYDAHDFDDELNQLNLSFGIPLTQTSLDI